MEKELRRTKSQTMEKRSAKVSEVLQSLAIIAREKQTLLRNRINNLILEKEKVIEKA
jgi:hypothetical protein